MTSRILVVRLGAMGDVIHALPAVASLRYSYPLSHVTWAVEPRWAPLLDGNPNVDAIVTLNRRNWASVRAAWGHLRESSFDLAVDLQGLIKSALVAKASGARRIVGYDASQVRERASALLYTEARLVHAAHVVDRHMELVAASGIDRVFELPQGTTEGQLPDTGFVLACPFAGWPSKEWPLERYTQLARMLPLPLVLNGHAPVEADLRRLKGVHVHISSVSGLIAATRRARAVVGVDSGPLHLAAALCKPGVAIFGPTDPARNGPYGDTIQVLRSSMAVTSYKRRREVDPSMLAITPQMVCAALERCL